MGIVLEKWGRRTTLGVSALFTIIGAVFQAAANGVPLMMIGRLVSGVALGVFLPGIPVYVAELAAPSERARLVGLNGFFVAGGYCLANWIGYACSFASGNLTWRLGLAMQIPTAVVLLAISIFLPESPRWRKSPVH